MAFDVTGTGLAARAEMHRVAYLRALGLDPERTLLAPVVRDLVGRSQEPMRVEIVEQENGTAEIVLTPLECPRPAHPERPAPICCVTGEAIVEDDCVTEGGPCPWMQGETP
jgi:hypothetical protein